MVKRDVLTAVRHDEGGQRGECLVSSNEETAIVEGLDLVVFDVVAPALLPVLHWETVAAWVVLARPHQECAARILVD